MQGWTLLHGTIEVPLTDEVADLLRDGLHTSKTGHDLLTRIRDGASRGETRIKLSDDEVGLVRNVLGLKLHASLPADVVDEINRIRNFL
jgi:hypothetical protein